MAIQDIVFAEGDIQDLIIEAGVASTTTLSDELWNKNEIVEIGGVSTVVYDQLTKSGTKTDRLVEEIPNIYRPPSINKNNVGRIPIY